MFPQDRGCSSMPTPPRCPSGTCQARTSCRWMLRCRSGKCLQDRDYSSTLTLPHCLSGTCLLGKDCSSTTKLLRCPSGTCLSSNGCNSLATPSHCLSDTCQPSTLCNLTLRCRSGMFLAGRSCILSPTAPRYRTFLKDNCYRKRLPSSFGMYQLCRKHSWRSKSSLQRKYISSQTSKHTEN
jgi:hypothetical protein